MHPVHQNTCNNFSRQLPPQKIKYSAINKMDSPDEDNPLTYMELKQKFSALHTDYHNLIGTFIENASYIKFHLPMLATGTHSIIKL